MKARNATRLFRSLAIVVCLCGGLTIRSLAAEPEHPQMLQPGKEHKFLQFDVGIWDATMKIWEKPDAKPVETKAVEKCEMLRGGFWLLSRFDGQIGSMKYSGAGTFGYDPTEKKFVGTWIDSMNPYMLTMKGDYDETTKTLTMMGENREPDGKMHSSKEIARRIDDNTRVFELHMQGDDGKYFKMMEITYKRRTGGASHRTETF
jgi:hypothetical protein